VLKGASHCLINFFLVNLHQSSGFAAKFNRQKTYIMPIFQGVYNLTLALNLRHPNDELLRVGTGHTHCGVWSAIDDHFYYSKYPPGNDFS
jgi:hypothetical protein